jgi:hypothetical protein
MQTITIQVIINLIVFGLGFLTQRREFHYQLRLAILTERLARCQEAHTLLDKLENNLDNTKGLHESNQECYQWYTTNSLSLSERTRKAYYNACLRSGGIFSIIGSNSRRTADESKAIETARDAVRNAIEAVAAEHQELSGTGNSLWIAWKERAVRLVRGRP